METTDEPVWTCIAQANQEIQKATVDRVTELFWKHGFRDAKFFPDEKRGGMTIQLVALNRWPDKYTGPFVGVPAVAGNQLNMSADLVEMFWHERGWSQVFLDYIGHLVYHGYRLKMLPPTDKSFPMGDPMAYPIPRFSILPIETYNQDGKPAVWFDPDGNQCKPG